MNQASQVRSKPDDPPSQSAIATASRQNTQSLMIPPISADLPSQVEETLTSCPKFRIALIGKSGVGKSSLVQKIFNIDPSEIDISDHRPGEADIDREYTSSVNPRFILHDSKGFEAGSGNNWGIVESFLRRHDAYPDISRKIHAIWLCLETPRPGARLLQTGDEQLLELAAELSIPIVAVFTKYDLLVNSFLRPRKGNRVKPADPEREALESFEHSLKDHHAISNCKIVRISMKDSNLREMLVKLADVTRELLHDVEGQLWVPWAMAQQASARQKVEVSIDEGFKKYWLDLGQSVAFEGQTLIDCVRRVHADILKVWNFHDPHEILSSTEFFTKTIALVKPLIEDNVNQLSRPNDKVQTWAGLTSIVKATGLNALMAPLAAIGLSIMAVKYLYDKYQRYPSTAKFLATYIVNLIVILHGVFMNILPSDPPRALSNDVVFTALALYESDPKTSPLDNIDSVPGFSTHPEKVIASIIKDRLHIEQD